MSIHSSDAGNVNIIGSGATGATVAGGSAIGVINEYAVLIGLFISIVSLLAGVYFKIQASKKEAKRIEEELAYREAEARASRQQIDALGALLELFLANQEGGRRKEDGSEEHRS